MNEYEFHELRNKVKTLEEKVERLEKQQLDAQASPSFPIENESNFVSKSVIKDDGLKNKGIPAVENTPSIEKPSKKNEPKTELKSASKSEELIDWEYTLGRVWLPRIFIFVFLFGVIWGFKAAVDYGIITEPVRCLIGGLVAVILFYFGQKQVDKQRHILGQTLLGGSVILLIISTFAGHMLYGLFSPTIALILNGCWILFGLFLSFKHKSESLAILSSFVGTMIPFLIESKDMEVSYFFVFEFMLYGIFLYVSYIKNYRILYVISSILLHIALLMSAVANFFDHFELPWYFGLVALMQHGLLLFFHVSKKELYPEQKGLFFSSFFVTLLWMYSSFDSDYVDYALLSFSILYIGMFVAVKKGILSIGSDRANVFLAIATYSSFIYMIHLFGDENYLLVALLVQSSLSLWVGYKTKSVFQKVNGWIVYIVCCFSFIPFLFMSLDSIFSSDVLTWVVFMGSLYFVREILKKEDEKGTSQTLLAIVLSILFVVFLTHVTLYFTNDFTMNIQYLSVSFVWCLYAIGAVIFGRSIKHVAIQRFGIIFIFITLIKVFLIDLPNVSIFIRAILFLGLGVFGLLMSRFYYSKK